ncbi:MAG: tRNA (adenosine(37)-N6)-threonylcarbamoyltransferase complex ATPase subunit type 1 TsaE [Ignavibacteria bacterium]|nr:tRNA (adenosine(37)-N6)-threonylcarbamoyltransferase complex ATPase subunit type 1 TsaE [Ignavibacteria bacterium]
MEEQILRSNSEAQTIMLGEQFATELRLGDVVAIRGELGAGKTEFVKGVCDYFAVSDLVTSPTFTIINQYTGITPDGDSIKIYHLDLYRIETPDQLNEVGFDDCVFAHDAIKLVEWSEKAHHLLPESHWDVLITTDPLDEESRTINIHRPKTV